MAKRKAHTPKSSMKTLTALGVLVGAIAAAASARQVGWLDPLVLPAHNALVLVSIECDRPQEPERFWPDELYFVVRGERVHTWMWPEQSQPLSYVRPIYFDETGTIQIQLRESDRDDNRDEDLGRLEVRATDVGQRTHRFTGAGGSYRLTYEVKKVRRVGPWETP